MVREWLTRSAVGMEGVVFKQLDSPYLPETRGWMMCKNAMNCSQYNMVRLAGLAISADHSSNSLACRRHSGAAPRTVAIDATLMRLIQQLPWSLRHPVRRVSSSAPNVVHLAPESAVFTAMKEVWARRQHARFLKASTIEPRLLLINRFEVFTGLYPPQVVFHEANSVVHTLEYEGGPRRRPLTYDGSGPCSTPPMPGRPRSAGTGGRGR
jgi:hypothetical protein